MNNLKETIKTRKRPVWKRVLFPVFGVLLFFIGLVGWIMPIVPGVPLMIFGAILIGYAHPVLEKKIGVAIAHVKAFFLRIATSLKTKWKGK